MNRMQMMPDEELKQTLSRITDRENTSGYKTGHGGWTTCHGMPTRVSRVVLKQLQRCWHCREDRRMGVQRNGPFSLFRFCIWVLLPCLGQTPKYEGNGGHC